MEASFKAVAGWAALGVEALVVVIIIYGALEALVNTMVEVFARRPFAEATRETWLRFAAWILLALEFALGADIIRTAVAPTWDDIGKLGAIAAIRTGLNFFLSRDLSEFREGRGSGAAEA